MTCEAVRGAEWYNNGPGFYHTARAQCHSVYPERVGLNGLHAGFTNSQFPHITSLRARTGAGCLFESGLQHLADRPEVLYNLPDAPKNCLKPAHCLG